MSADHAVNRTRRNVLVQFEKHAAGVLQTEPLPAGMYANLRSGKLMKDAGLFMELLATYRKHGWQLRGALLQPATRSELGEQEAELVKDVAVREAEVDALWFSRPSHQNREAWELRLLSQTPYALFETFEPDETEEERDDMKREMEARMRDYASSK